MGSELSQELPHPKGKHSLEFCDYAFVLPILNFIKRNHKSIYSLVSYLLLNIMPGQFIHAHACSNGLSILIAVYILLTIAGCMSFLQSLFVCFIVCFETTMASLKAIFQDHADSSQGPA